MRLYTTAHPEDEDAEGDAAGDAELAQRHAAVRRVAPRRPIAHRTSDDAACRATWAFRDAEDAQYCCMMSQGACNCQAKGSNIWPQEQPEGSLSSGHTMHQAQQIFNAKS